MSVAIGLIANGRGYLAADRLVADTSGDARSDQNKIHRLKDGSYIAFCGSLKAWENLLELIKEYGGVKEIPCKAKLTHTELSALWLCPGPHLFLIQCDLSLVEITKPPYCAVGIGGDLATGSLAAWVGLSGIRLRRMQDKQVRKTLRYVMKTVFAFNKFCGGKVSIRTVA